MDPMHIILPIKKEKNLIVLYN